MEGGNMDFGFIFWSFIISGLLARVFASWLWGYGDKPGKNKGWIVIWVVIFLGVVIFR